MIFITPSKQILPYYATYTYNTYETSEIEKKKYIIPIKVNVIPNRPQNLLINPVQ